MYVRNNPLRYVDPTGMFEEDRSNVLLPNTLEDLNNFRIGVGIFEQTIENMDFSDRAKGVITKFAFRPISREMFILALSENTGNYIFDKNNKIGKKSIKAIKNSVEYKKIDITSII